MALADQLALQGLPANLLAERSVLGAILLEGNLYYQAAELLVPDDFHLEAHRKIFRALRDLAQAATAVDYITLGEALERSHDLEAVGGHAYLTTLTDGLPRGLNLEHYARIVKDRAVERQCLSAANEVSQAVLSGASGGDALELAQRLFFAIASGRVQERLHSVSELTPAVLEKLDALRGQEISGLRTGFTELDQLTAGLQPADLIIVAGRPSMGKTSLAMNMVENAALKYGKTAAIFSLEMSKVQLVLRMLCSTARVNAHKLRTGFLGRDDIAALTAAAGQLAQAAIYIDDSSGIDLSTLRAKCRRLAAELATRRPARALDLVVVDYLQLMGSTGRVENRNLEISALSRGFKLLAKELNTPVVAISQLSRAPEQRTGSHEPILSDLRESGSIEQDADVVAFIYRDEVYHRDSEDRGKAKIIVAKQRNGPTDSVMLAFLREYTRFENLQESGPADS
ncbi:MAG: replicative DNA helicase [Terriglobales bacterium]